MASWRAVSTMASVVLKVENYKRGRFGWYVPTTIAPPKDASAMKVSLISAAPEPELTWSYTRSQAPPQLSGRLDRVWEDIHDALSAHVHAEKVQTKLLQTEVDKKDAPYGWCSYCPWCCFCTVMSEFEGVELIIAARKEEQTRWLALAQEQQARCAQYEVQVGLAKETVIVRRGTTKQVMPFEFGVGLEFAAFAAPMGAPGGGVAVVSAVAVQSIERGGQESCQESPLDKLAKLAQLHQAGAITDAEYESKKRGLMQQV